MTEPGAGSDLRGMTASAKADGDDFVLNGTKHFISHADIADFAIAFMATGEEETPRGPKKLITAFFVDKARRGSRCATDTALSRTAATKTAFWSSTIVVCMRRRCLAMSMAVLL